MTTYYDLVAQYGEDNTRHMGNKIIVIDRRHKIVIGYTVASYNGYTPNALCSKIYSALENLDGDTTWDNAYDWLFGTPDGTILPDFTQVVAVINS